MAKKKKSKKKKRPNAIFESIRKPTVGKGSKFKTRKAEKFRKRKHKGKETE